MIQKTQIETALYNSFNKSLISLDESFLLRLSKNNEINFYYKNLSNLYLSIVFALKSNFISFKKIIDKSINNLEEKEKKTSEDLALLSILYGNTLKNKSILNQNIKIITKAKFFAEKAKSMNKYNIRAYYALALVNMYSASASSKYKDSQDILVDAIEIYKSKLDSESEVKWGADWCYALMITIQAINKDNKLHQVYYNEAISFFPNSEYIKNANKKTRQSK
jgi:hypothetical protein